MPKITETCSCGATFQAEMAGWYAEINLQRAVKDWRDAHMICRAAKAEKEKKSDNTK